jgi:predicted RNA-binding Zn-ribbon protein involved in translation (DUF1610 family)
MAIKKRNYDIECESCGWLGNLTRAIQTRESDGEYICPACGETETFVVYEPPKEIEKQWH